MSKFVFNEISECRDFNDLYNPAGLKFPVLKSWKLKEEHTTLYFGYGSNMDPYQMSYRCPNANLLVLQLLTTLNFSLILEVLHLLDL